MIQLDGRPADRALIESMTASLAFRGPDGRHVWTGASAALGHTLHKTTFEAESECQPASIDGQVWITADGRIDAREDLARELGLPQSALARPDCELILHAYARWAKPVSTIFLAISPSPSGTHGPASSSAPATISALSRSTTPTSPARSFSATP